MCFTGGTWKREVVPDHKFDFVDTREFTDNSAGMRFKYLWLYVIILKDFLVYVSDIFTAVTMLSTDSWSNAIFNSCPPDQTNGCVYIPFRIAKWLFFGCIIFSFLLLAYEGHKARKIIKSRDISYAFTSVMANHYYSLRSYDHFCFFNHISNSTKRMDDFAFFVFFTFKSWKRLLLADGPRQVINALTLYAFYLSREKDGDWYDLGKYFAGNDLVTTALTISTAFTVLVFAGSLLLLIIAGVCYIPLLCHIQGNLKEYCCHKVDKRITEIIKRRNKQRLAKAAALAKKEAAGDYSHLKNKKGELIAQPLRQPTLPNLSVDDPPEDFSSQRTKAYAPSTLSGVVSTNNDYYYNDRKDYPPGDYPPMPAYNQPYGHYPDYYGSTPALPDEHAIYDDEYGSTAHLATSAAPFARADDAGSAAPSYASTGYYGHDPAAHHGSVAQPAYGHLDAHQDPIEHRGPSPAATPYNHLDYTHDPVGQRGPSPAVYGQAYAHDSEIAYGEASPAYPGGAQYRSNTPMDSKGHDGYGHAM
ncbi:hypothetical protein EIP91_012040 [Steccherinum ochraceum]|uniref:Vacuole protein n=1 Tax=Steccherinum ochraceum TaxID=92696 RepID=A0A4R0RXF3_9APHY|nr:hypothetical protein EIP91_012040 [Steccherinum ochraceum]